MNNCQECDDIDIMIICAPSTVWLTRLFVWLMLSRSNLRRPALCDDPKKVANKICDNVYLDSSSLDIRRFLSPKSDYLYLAHEIIQAKPLFDRYDTFNKFIYSNSWIRNFLPHACNLDIRNSQLIIKDFLLSLIFTPLNWLFFIPQYTYMYRRLKGNHISFRAAFFHPKPIQLSFVLDKTIFINKYTDIN